VTELAQLEIPWSEGIAGGFRLMSGGALMAARQAAAGSPALHIGGGFHHAFADHGEGFCLFNDVALAIRVLQRDGTADRAAVVDLDVHHGNGTASIFEADPTVFTFSMHQQNNYPMEKPPSTLDIGLVDAAGDEVYLGRLESALPVVMAHASDVLFYLAGADPYERDQLGGLGLTKAGLRARDRLVLEAASDAGVPVAVVLAGGYAYDVDDTVTIHVATAEEAARIA
jgi:acetoin utilization deacetylase AcuC-like enzyme